MNEAWKFTSWPEEINELNTKTIQNFDADDIEGWRDHQKPNFELLAHMIYQNLRFYVHEYVFGAREFISDIRFEIWPILREMGVKKGIFRVKNGQKHFCQ